MVDLVRGARSRLTGQQIQVVAAGGLFDGRGLAASLVHGASAVWVGTRFVATNESGAPKPHKEAIVKARDEEIVKTTIFTGRPLHIVNTPYIQSWLDRPDKIKELQDQGLVPVEWDLQNDPTDEKVQGVLAHWFAGKVAAAINDIRPAKDVVDSMVREAAEALETSTSRIIGRPNL